MYYTRVDREVGKTAQDFQVGTLKVGVGDGTQFKAIGVGSRNITLLKVTEL